MSLLLCLLFFLSGASALTFETLWFHQAGLALGNSVWASSLVLAGFMGGLGLGNGLAAGFGDRVGGPVRAYAGLEALMVPEPCTSLVDQLPDSGCAATCLRCACGQPIVASPMAFVASDPLVASVGYARPLTLPVRPPHDIFHVPKSFSLTV